MNQCPNCGGGLQPNANRCLKCGTAIQPVAQAPHAYPPQPQYPPPQQAYPTPQPNYAPNPTVLKKSRGTYVLLAILLGGLGIHNFYAGRTGIGIAQLVISLIGSFVGAPCAIWIWAVIEAITVTRDGQGVPFN